MNRAIVGLGILGCFALMGVAILMASQLGDLDPALGDLDPALIFGGMLIIIFLVVSAIWAPHVGLAIALMFLLNNYYLDMYAPPKFSPFLATLAALCLVAILRFALGYNHKVSIDIKISASLAGFCSWSFLYALARFGEFPISAFLHLAVPLFIFLIFIQLMQQRQTVIWAFYGLLVGYIIFCVLMLPDLYYGSTHISGGYFNTEMFRGEDRRLHYTSIAWILNVGATLCLGFVIRGSRLNKIVGVALYALIAATALLTFARGAPVGLGAGLLAICVVMAKQKNYRALIFVSVMAGLFLIVYMGSPMWLWVYEYKTIQREITLVGQSRFWLAYDGLVSIALHPLLGRGGGGSPTHSYLLDIPWQYGIPAALVLYYAILRLWVRSWRLATSPPSPADSRFDQALKLGCFLAFCVSIVQGIFDPVLRTPFYAIVFWLLRSIETYYWGRQQLEAPTPQAHKSLYESRSQPIDS